MSNSTLKKAWYDYVSKGIAPAEAVRPTIYDSWRRCGELEVDPWQKTNTHLLDPIQLAHLQARSRQLIEICLPYMNSLYAFVQGSGFVIALTDKNGVLLKIVGDSDIREQIKTGGFIEGADYTEKSVGTNAIGTALFLNEPVQVYSYEHYCRCSQVSTGSCALLRDGEGQVIGTICMVGYDYNVHSHTLGMTVAAAEAIHRITGERKLQRAYRMSDAYKSTIMDCVSQGVLALDMTGVLTHINRRAYRMLSLDPELNYLRQPLSAVLSPGNAGLLKIVSERQRLTDQEIIINTPRGPLPFAVTTRTVQAGGEQQPAGIVIVLDELRRVRKIMQHMSGAVAPTSFDDLVGVSPQYRETVRIAKNAALSDFNVLLLGESGTGKDVFAQAIHNYSNRSDGPFVAINCSAIPRELIGSELFGYVEGAYTGARKGGSSGKFELADGGTIFLDEIGDMPLDLQGHLLRVIEERKITRIGGHDLISVNVRIIAATNRNLPQDITLGRFRQDLYYRLNVLTIHMVPLRERLNDLPLLVALFYRKLAEGFGLEPQPVSDHFLEVLCRYSYPGNIRELQNIIERTLVLSGNGVLEVSNLPEEVRRASEPAAVPRPASAAEAGEPVRVDSEREALYALLLKNRGNISRTAKELGIARSTKYGFQTTITSG